MDASNNANDHQVTKDLSLVSVNDLIAELMKRHDAVVFAGKIHRSALQYTVTRRWNGHRDTCLAMCSNLESLINDAENKSLGPVIE